MTSDFQPSALLDGLILIATRLDEIRDQLHNIYQEMTNEVDVSGSISVEIDRFP